MGIPLHCLAATLVATLAVSVLSGMQAQELQTMIWDRKSKWNAAQPELQNHPLDTDPVLSRARPPKPVLADGGKPPSIFLGLAGFRDGFRCGKTIFTAYSHADFPDRLFVGVVDQRATTDEACLDEYCKLAAAKWPEHGDCRYQDHIRIFHMEAEESRGPTLARANQQTLIQDEEFCLELDAHSILLPSWDTKIIADWARADNEMAVLSTYIEGLEHMQSDGKTHVQEDQSPHLCRAPMDSKLFRNQGAGSALNARTPIMSPFWGAGLSFSKCHAERRVKVNPHTPWLFNGEEFLRASHLWTFGYDMYSPSLNGLVAMHNYSHITHSFMQLQVDQEKKERETQMGENRVSLELHRPYSGPVDSEEYGQYNFGSARSIEQYMVFAGLANPDKLEDRCYQLHWVPFRDPTEIEKLVPGYHMLPDDLVAAHHPQARPQVAQAQRAVVLGRVRPHSVQLAEESSTGTAEEQAGSRRRWRTRVESPSERRVVLELDTQFLYVCMAGMAFLWLSGLLVIMRLVGARGRGRSGGR